MKEAVIFFKGSLIIIILFTCSLLKAESPLCKNLYEATCAPGIVDDGTGIANVNGNKDIIEKQREKVRPRIRALLDKAMFGGDLDSKDEKDYFRNLAMELTGTIHTDNCVSKEESEISECNKATLHGMMNFSLDYIFVWGGLDRRNEEQPQRDLEAILNVSRDKLFSSIVETISGEISDEIQESTLLQKVEAEYFKEAKRLLKESLGDYIPDNDELIEKMKTKIGAISWEDLPCNRAFRSGENISAAFTPNAFYASSGNSARICKGILLGNSSEFSLMYILVHELVHSIDPCGITRGAPSLSFQFPSNLSVKQADNVYPIKGLISCLRSEDSIKAKRQKSINEYGTGNVVSNGMTGMDSPEDESFDTYCKEDQITEAVSDSIGIDILTKYIQKKYIDTKILHEKQVRKGYSNVLKALCGRGTAIRKVGEYSSGSSNLFDVHSSVRDRVILLQVHPEVRKQMGCTSKPEKRFCDPSKNRNRKGREPKPKDRREENGSVA